MRAPHTGAELEELAAAKAFLEEEFHVPNLFAFSSFEATLCDLGDLRKGEFCHLLGLTYAEGLGAMAVIRRPDDGYLELVHYSRITCWR